MSLSQTALLERSQVPDRTRLQDAIRALGFDLAVDDFYRPFDCSGFLPCILGGKKSGFEIYFQSPDETFRSFPHLKETAAGRDSAVTFRWGGDMRECACVLIVSAALAKSFGAVIHYEPDDLVYSEEQLLAEAKQAIESAEMESSQSGESPPQPPRRRPWWRFWQ